MAKSEPADVPAADERAFTDELFGAELFWEKNKTLIIGGAVALVLVALGVGAWIAYRSLAERDAQEAFALADSVTAWREVAEKFPDSVVAGSARLLAASALRDEGDFEASTAGFETVLSANAAYPLAGVARLGLAENAAAQGEAARASELLQEAGAGEGFEAPLALFLLARAQLAEGDFAAAGATIEGLTIRFPDSLPAQLAPRLTEEIELVSPPAEPPPTPQETP